MSSRKQIAQVSSNNLTGNLPSTDFKKTGIEAVIFEEGDSLAKIRKNTSEVLAAQIIAREIITVFEFFGAEPNDTQILISSELIVEQFYFLKPQEVRFAFRKGMAGKYGKVFGKFNPSFLLDWLNVYLEKRHESAANVSQNTHLELKSGKPKRDEAVNIEGIEKLAEMWRKASDKHKLQTPEAEMLKVRYSSIEAAIEQNGIEGAKERMLEMWHNEWRKTEFFQSPKLQKRLGIDWGVFQMWKYNEFLNALNKIEL